MYIYTFMVTFQNKTLRVDTSIPISKKRQTQDLLLWSRKYDDAYIVLGFTVNMVRNEERPVLCLKTQLTAWNNFDNQVIVCRMLQLIQWFIQKNKWIFSNQVFNGIWIQGGCEKFLSSRGAWQKIIVNHCSTPLQSLHSKNSIQHCSHNLLLQPTPSFLQRLETLDWALIA